MNKNCYHAKYPSEYIIVGYDKVQNKVIRQYTGRTEPYCAKGYEQCKDNCPDIDDGSKAKRVILVCPICQNKFSKPESQYNAKLKNGTKSFCCTTECANILKTGVGIKP